MPRRDGAHGLRAATVVVVAGLLLVSACGGSSSPATASSSTSTPSPAAVDTTAGTPTSDALHLLVLGDSIAIPSMGCGSCDGFDKQYAAYLQQATGREVELSNRAQGGAQILDLQSFLDTDTSVEAEVANADVVVVSIGYNSGPPFDSDEPCHAPDAVHDIDQLNAILAFTPECVQATLEIRRVQLENVYATVKALAGDRPQVRITFGVFNNLKDNPGGDGTFADFSPEDMAKVEAILVSLTDDWNAMDCKAATAEGFACADLYHAFNGPDGTKSVKGLVAADFTHPSQAGQEVMARILQAVALDPLI